MVIFNPNGSYVLVQGVVPGTYYRLIYLYTYMHVYCTTAVPIDTFAKFGMEIPVIHSLFTRLPLVVVSIHVVNCKLQINYHEKHVQVRTFSINCTYLLTR